MAFKPFKTIKIDPASTPTSKNVNDLQFNINQSVSQLLGKDYLDMNHVQNISLNPGLNVVSHGLNRKIQGWIVSRPRNGYALLWENVTVNNSPNLLVYINSAASCIVDFLFF